AAEALDLPSEISLAQAVDVAVRRGEHGPGVLTQLRHVHPHAARPVVPRLPAWRTWLAQTHLVLPRRIPHRRSTLEKAVDEEILGRQDVNVERAQRHRLAGRHPLCMEALYVGHGALHDLTVAGKHGLHQRLHVHWSSPP